MYKDLSLKDRAKIIREGVRLGLTSIDDILSLYDDAISYLQEGPIISPYGQWKYPGKDTIIPSNNITMDNVNYPVLGVSDAGDAKVMMPWNDYKFRGSVVYEHPLIGNQFQLGGNTKPTFDLWYPTVPKRKNDTSSYDLRRAYNMLPFEEMEKFRTIDNYHLPSVAYDEKTDTYTFLKRNGHPTLNYELDWYNSGSPDALEFRERYKLDTLSLPWRYIPRTFLIGGLAKKPEPIYNENGQVIGRRYINRDNPKVIDNVVPQGRVNFQEFLKAKGKKARATNFEDLELFLDSLIARGYNEPLRLAFLATSYNEMDNKGAASRGIGGNGYMGFNTVRMPLNLLNDSSKQIQYILDDTEKLTPDNWTDGGSGGPYIKNLIDAFDKFWNETNPNTATLILNKTNIRPAKLSDWYLRASDADLMKQYMEYPELPKEEEQKQKKSNKLLDSFVDFILSGGLQNTPSYADGGNLLKKGGIYIKPENRGKFTALKKRTGHSASWFKAHGTPALKKMATFALNSRHWNHKHDDGGHLFLEDGQIFKRPLNDLTRRNILTSPILPPKSWYELFTIPELKPKKPQPLQPLEGTYGNKYSELVPMSDETYANNPINKGLLLDWRTFGAEIALPFIAAAGPAIGSTATWLAASKPALYNLGRMTLGSEIGGRSVDLASNLFTGNTWGLNVGNVVEGITGWNPNNTMVGLFVTDLTNPGYSIGLGKNIKLKKDIDPNKLFSYSEAEYIKPEDFPQVNIFKNQKPKLDVENYLQKHKQRIVDKYGEDAYNKIKLYTYNQDEKSIKRAIRDAIWDDTHNLIYALDNNFINLKYKELAKLPAFNIGRQAIVVNPELTKKIYPSVFELYGDDAALGLIKSHELEHAINWYRQMHPDQKATNGIFDLTKILKDSTKNYFEKQNNTELSARGSLIKDYFDSDMISGDLLRFAARNYVKDTGIDNDMTAFFNGIKDWDGMAKWITKNSSIIAAPFLIGNIINKYDKDLKDNQTHY